MTLHDGQELDNDLRGGTDQDLALASLLGAVVVLATCFRLHDTVSLLVDRIQAIVEDGCLDHVCGCMRRFSMAVGRLRYLRFGISLQMPEHGECPQCAYRREGSSALVAKEKQCRAHPCGRLRLHLLAL